MSTQMESASLVIPAPALLEHWQGHRRLTRRVIEAFPEEQLFKFTIGSMRPFGAMAMELLAIAEPMVRGIVTEQWDKYDQSGEFPKKEILRRWDESTEKINALWPRISPSRFHEKMMAFGQYPGRVYELILYGIDNEIHHRGQGYVYLRALGIEPPAFYER
jgi:uncharacterized damage-inducible protein DinB